MHFVGPIFSGTAGALLAAKKTTGRPTIKSSHRGGAAKVGAAKKAKAPGAPRAPKKTPAQVKRAAVIAPTLRDNGAPRSKRIAKTAAPVESVASDAARQMAIDIAAAGLEKKALGVEILDVAGRVDYADFLVLMTGRSDRQVMALSQGIEESLRTRGKRPLAVEGLPHALWVVMDFGDVVVHLFQEHARSAYDLDGLWMDARRIPVPAS
jgi:ribosome-associated protein